jgi:hypothetical protein
MRKFSDLSDAELAQLKTSHSKINHRMQAGETRWCDRLNPWERFELNVDTTVDLLFFSKNISEDDSLRCRRDNPELYDLIKSTFANG